jgi:hypothetical protein
LPEPVDDLELRVAEVLSTLAHAPLEHPVVADHELLLLDQQPREHAEHPPHGAGVRLEDRVELRGADLHRLAVRHRDDGGGARRAVEHGELAERVTRPELGEDVHLRPLGAAHLERPADDQVQAVAGRALLEHGLAGRVTARASAPGQRVERSAGQASEYLALPQVRRGNPHKTAV